MQNPVPHIIRQNIFWVSPERSLFWEEQNTVIIADLHLGKTGHFRKAGIAVPQSIYKADLQRLLSIIYLYKAERLIIVGDFSHSSANKEMDLFLRWRKDFASLSIDLVKGNHDILSDSWYKEADIAVYEKELRINDFCFRHGDKVHKPKENIPVSGYTFNGHLHPGITLKGQGRQSLRFPCFYFRKENCILPAFSRFTGTYKVVRKENETVYAIVNNELISIAS